MEGRENCNFLQIRMLLRGIDRAGRHLSFFRMLQSWQKCIRLDVSLPAPQKEKDNGNGGNSRSQLWLPWKYDEEAPISSFSFEERKTLGGSETTSFLPPTYMPKQHTSMEKEGVGRSAPLSLLALRKREGCCCCPPFASCH